LIEKKQNINIDALDCGIHQEFLEFRNLAGFFSNLKNKFSCNEATDGAKSQV
jgi:hypothetical protein